MIGRGGVRSRLGLDRKGGCVPCLSTLWCRDSIELIRTFSQGESLGYYFLLVFSLIFK